VGHERAPDLGSDAVARAAQATATALTIAEGLIRLRAQRAPSPARVNQAVAEPSPTHPRRQTAPEIAVTSRRPVATRPVPYEPGRRPDRVIVGEAFPVPIGEAVTAAAASPLSKAPVAALPAPITSAALHR
jgi:hypothetical protein